MPTLTDRPNTWSQDVDSVLSAFSTDPAVGLNTAEVVLRREKIGRNQLSPPKRRKLLYIVADQFNSLVVLLLCIAGGIGRPSMEATPRNQALWAQAKAVGGRLGLVLRAARAGGGSDGNTTSQFTATLDGLGPVGDGAHAEHEYLCINETLERTALLAMLLLEPHIPDPLQGVRP
jgi:acetylornithine deacetylase/succinyl-diaminopimelate desuccinylase-like protein